MSFAATVALIAVFEALRTPALVAARRSPRRAGASRSRCSASPMTSLVAGFADRALLRLPLQPARAVRPPRQPSRRPGDGPRGDAGGGGRHRRLARSGSTGCPSRSSASAWATSSRSASSSPASAAPWSACRPGRRPCSGFCHRRALPRALDRPRPLARPRPGRAGARPLGRRRPPRHPDRRERPALRHPHPGGQGAQHRQRQRLRRRQLARAATATAPASRPAASPRRDGPRPRPRRGRGARPRPFPLLRLRGPRRRDPRRLPRRRDPARPELARGRPRATASSSAPSACAATARWRSASPPARPRSKAPAPATTAAPGPPIRRPPHTSGDLIGVATLAGD